MPISGVGPEPAAHEDVVGLPALPGLVARGRALEADVADPVLGAGVRAAVELQPRARRPSSPKRSSRPSIRRPSRVFVSATEKLQCGSPVQAIASPRRRLTSSGKPISSSARVASSTALVRDAGDDEVLLAREADVAAERPRRDRRRAISCPRVHQPEMHRDADVGEARLLLRVDAHVVDRLGERRRLVVLERAGRGAPRRARACPPAPMSSTMNLRRAFTRETR